MPPTRTYTSYEGDGDSRSATSHKSTQSSRSSVLQRAREYNRRIDSERERAKSMERNVSDPSQDDSPRSQSAGRHAGNRASTKERAMASVRDVRSELPSPANNSSNGSSKLHSRPSSTSPRSKPKPKQHQKPPTNP